MTDHKPGDRVFICVPPQNILAPANVVATGSVAYLTKGQVPAGSERGAAHGVQVQFLDGSPSCVLAPSLVFKTPEQAAIAMIAYLSACGEAVKAWLAQQKGDGPSPEPEPAPEPPSPIITDYDPADAKAAMAAFDKTVRTLRITDN